MNRYTKIAIAIGVTMGISACAVNNIMPSPAAAQQTQADEVVLASGAYDVGPVAQGGAITQGSQHTVVSGDTCWNISQRAGVTVAALVAANSLQMTGSQCRIRLGQTLNIPGAS